MPNQTEAGQEFAAGAAHLVGAIEDLSTKLRDMIALLESNPEFARRLDRTVLDGARTMLDAGDELHTETRGLAARLNTRLPQLAVRLKKLRRAIDRAQGD